MLLWCILALSSVMYLSSWQMKYKERVLGLILVSPVCKAPSWTEWLYNKVWSRSLSQLNLWESENSMEPTMDANQKICNQLNVGTDRCLVSKRILIWQPAKNWTAMHYMGIAWLWNWYTKRAKDVLVMPCVGITPWYWSQWLHLLSSLNFVHQ